MPETTKKPFARQSLDELRDELAYWRSQRVNVVTSRHARRCIEWIIIREEEERANAKANP